MAPRLRSIFTHLLTLSTDLNGIGDELSRLFLLQTGHFLQLDGNLKGAQDSEESRKPRPSGGPSVATCGATHCGLPAEDVAVETDPVLGEVEAALEEDLPLQGAGVI